MYPGWRVGQFYGFGLRRNRFSLGNLFFRRLVTKRDRWIRTLHATDPLFFRLEEHIFTYSYLNAYSVQPIKLSKALAVNPLFLLVSFSLDAMQSKKVFYWHLSKKASFAIFCDTLGFFCFLNQHRENNRFRAFLNHGYAYAIKKSIISSADTCISLLCLVG
jgi:hypothetical protein